MAKMKVYELAKELDVQSKDVVAYLTENGSSVKSHASNIEDKEIEMVRGKFGKKAAPAEKAGDFWLLDSFWHSFKVFLYFTIKV